MLLCLVQALLNPARRPAAGTSMMISRIDQRNALLTGAVELLQMVQNAAVSLHPAEGLLMELHCLPVDAHIKFKDQLDLLSLTGTILFQPMVPSSAAFNT